MLKPIAKSLSYLILGVLNYIQSCENKPFLSVHVIVGTSPVALLQ